MKFSIEPVQKVWTEVAPLLQAHYEEIAWKQDKIPLIPDKKRYFKLQDARILKVFTVRHLIDNELIGYSVYLLTPTIHYSTTLFATNDILFLKPEFRGVGLGKDFLDFCEKQLKLFGVQVISLHIKDQLDFGPLAAHLQYERVETTWLKWIGD